MSDTPVSVADGAAADDGLVLQPEPIVAGAVASDPISDVEANKPKNRPRVGSLRPSALLYPNGIGATVDLPHMSVMPHGLDAWEPIYARRPGPVDAILEPRLLELVRSHLGSQVAQLRKLQSRCDLDRQLDEHGPELDKIVSIVA